MNAFILMFVMSEFLGGTCLFAFRFPRRKMFLLRFIPFILVAFGLTYLMGAYFRGGSWSRFIIFFVQYLFCAGMAFLCFQVGIIEAMVCGACGFAIQHFTSNFCTLIGLRIHFPSDWHPFLTNVLFGVLFRAPLYVLTALTTARKLKNLRVEGQGRIIVSFLSIAIVLVCVGISRFARDGNVRTQSTIIAESLYAMVCCLSSLALLVAFHSNRKLRQSENTLRILLQQERHQFEVRKESLEALQIQLHDLRHSLNRLEQTMPDSTFSSLQQVLEAYNPAFKTGNSALDITLGASEMLCKKNEISLTFIGDGHALDFLEAADLYSLIENALDNAIEAVAGLEKEKRHISVDLEKAGDLVIIEIINYYRWELSFEKGLPLSTKEKDGFYHGFGMLSIQKIAEKYGGGISVQTENGIFSLVIRLLDTSRQKAQ